MIARNTMTVAVAGALWLAACGSNDDSGLESTGGGAGTSADGSAGSSSGGSAGSAGTAGASGSSGSGTGGSAGSDCTGTQPEVDAGERYCAPGQCRCEGSDLCFDREVVEACCDGKFRCFSKDGGADCEGRHPEVDGGARFCKPGDCYCQPSDTCYAADSAAACCPTAPKCG
jgi:hypothetical protein